MNYISPIPILRHVYVSDSDNHKYFRGLLKSNILFLFIDEIKDHGDIFCGVTIINGFMGPLAYSSDTSSLNCLWELEFDFNDPPDDYFYSDLSF